MVQILSWTVRLYKHLYRNVNLGSSIVPYWTTKEVWRGEEGEMKLARKLVPDVRPEGHTKNFLGKGEGCEETNLRTEYLLACLHY